MGAHSKHKHDGDCRDLEIPEHEPHDLASFKSAPLIAMENSNAWSIAPGTYLR